MSSLTLTREITPDGKLELAITSYPIPKESELADEEVLVRVEAAPINPSDIGPL